MTPPAAPSGALAGLLPRARPAASETLCGEAWRRFRRHRLAAPGGVVLLVMVAAVLTGPWLWRVPINEIDFKAKLQGTSLAHPLRTDHLRQGPLCPMLSSGGLSA